MTTTRTERDQEALEILARLHNDFTFFIETLQKIYKGGDFYNGINEVEAELLEWADFRPSKGGHAERGLLAPRGWGKSTWVSAGYAAFRLMNDPSEKILICSSSEVRSREIFKLIRSWIDNVWFLKHLRPPRGKRVRDNQKELDVSGVQGTDEDKTPSLRCIGGTGAKTGGRASLVILDDMETTETSQSPTIRANTLHGCLEFTAVASYGECEVLVVGTPHHEDTLYLRLAGMGYRFKSFPLLVPSEKDSILNLCDTVQHKRDTGEWIVGQCCFPHRYRPDQIARYREKGDVWFAQQYMMIYDLGEGSMYPLKLRNLIVPTFAVDPKTAPVEVKWGTARSGGVSTVWGDIKCLGLADDMLHKEILYSTETRPYQRTVMCIDPSGSGGDETGYAIVGYLAGLLWVKAWGGMTGECGPEQLEALADLAKHWDAREIIFEDDFGQGAFRHLMEPIIAKRREEASEGKPGYACKVSIAKGYRVTKERRILSTLVPIVQNHRLVVSRDAIEPVQGLEDKFQNQFQFSRIGPEKGQLEHDDRIDALAGACAPFLEMLDFANDGAEDTLRQRAREEELIRLARERAVKHGRGSVDVRWADPFKGMVR